MFLQDIIKEVKQDKRQRIQEGLSQQSSVDYIQRHYDQVESSDNFSIKNQNNDRGFIKKSDSFDNLFKNQNQIDDNSQNSNNLSQNNPEYSQFGFNSAVQGNIAQTQLQLPNKVINNRDYDENPQYTSFKEDKRYLQRILNYDITIYSDFIPIVHFLEKASQYKRKQYSQKLYRMVLQKIQKQTPGQHKRYTRRIEFKKGQQFNQQEKQFFKKIYNFYRQTSQLENEDFKIQQKQKQQMNKQIKNRSNRLLKKFISLLREIWNNYNLNNQDFICSILNHYMFNNNLEQNLEYSKLQQTFKEYIKLLYFKKSSNFTEDDIKIILNISNQNDFKLKIKQLKQKKQKKQLKKKRQYKQQTQQKQENVSIFSLKYICVIGIYTSKYYNVCVKIFRNLLKQYFPYDLSIETAVKTRTYKSLIKMNSFHHLLTSYIKQIKNNQQILKRPYLTKNLKWKVKDWIDEGISLPNKYIKPIKQNRRQNNDSSDDDQQLQIEEQNVQNSGNQIQMIRNQNNQQYF